MVVAAMTRKGEHVLERGEEGIAYLLMEEDVPDADPEDDDGAVCDDHVRGGAAKSIDDKDGSENGAALGNDVPHIDVGLAS